MRFYACTQQKSHNLFRAVENSIKQCFAAYIDNIEQHNVGSKTLFNAVVNNPEQVVRLLLCSYCRRKTRLDSQLSVYYIHSLDVPELEVIRIIMDVYCVALKVNHF